ncbi:MAG: sensor histidine kinase, partial [Rhodobacteraceae bacterium]|nr:sensor histidine kinase [Paracoccaceae bacterium]
MTLPSRQRAALLLLFLTVTLLIGATVWRVSYDTALRGVTERGQADLALASDRFIAQLHRFQEIAVLMSDHPTLGARLQAGEMASSDLAADAGALLLSVADKTGLYNIILLDPQGRVQAAAHPQEAVRLDHARLNYFARAKSGALGAYHSVLRDDDRRIYVAAAPVHADYGPPLGAVVVVADIESMESEWRGDAPVVMFRDRLGVVFVSSRSELVLTRDGASAPMSAPSGDYADGVLRAFPSFSQTQIGPHEVWQISAGPYIPTTAIHLTRDLPVIGFTAEVLADASPAVQLALLQALVAAGMFVAAVLLGLYLLSRRHRMQRKLDREAAAKEVLERRVVERTAELSRTNRALRREVEDRTRAEEALRTTQAKLVQAGKLSALGEMSAGISHELNQPLMAIRSFAENGAQFIEMGRQDVAAANLTKISELALRMGRIIKN